MVATMTSVSAMAMKQVHQRAGEQEQIGPPARQVSPVFTNQVRFGIPFSQTSVATARSRDDVRREAIEAVRTGQISIGGV